MSKMCNEIKCAVQENVQIGCTGNVHNFEYISGNHAHKENPAFDIFLKCSRLLLKTVFLCT